MNHFFELQRILRAWPKMSALGLALLLAPACQAWAQSTTFAEPPITPSGQPQQALSSLADIMGKTQSRHIKLWYAIKARNWDLMAYELGHLRDTFESAVILYQNIPVEFIVGADKPLIALEEIIKAKDTKKLEQGFGALTSGCNSCHQAAQIGFIVIQTPTSMPFSDQQFTPRRN
jgi:hypothetical protein